MDLWTVQLGRVPYAEALALQERLRAARQADAIPDTVLILEHPPVYTRGKRSDPAELPLGEAWYRDRGIEIVDVDRGGKVTYHGPGQLVAYPIARVTDVLGFVSRLEEAMVAALGQEGVTARGRARDGREFTGTWVGDRKIGSIGLHVSKGVTTHGLSVNVDNDMTPFEWIVPCGLGGVAMTSVAMETDAEGARLPCFRKRMGHELARALGARQRLVTPARLARELAGLTVG
ncbi:lipoyl(octanoyl) transferase LipB [Baekduia soli]|uniref:lipoyl(octanoyl) transferase LipB n=1 Tax=Baekduia soli TaxID=496014 RepID=UPI001651B7D6|nr:lipoyl(octanoyl) transferase LipB [Baekduia soli]